jgi:uncharacterized iron-regulated membrane protein
MLDKVIIPPSYIQVGQNDYDIDCISPIILSINLVTASDRFMNSRFFRQLHRQLAPIFLLPFMVTAITGVAYRLGKNWFGFSKEQVHFLMVIHEGEYLGTSVKPFYVLLNGLGMLMILITGGVMWFESVRRSPWFKQLKSRFNSSPVQAEEE